jgi:2-dehydro-3-deoxyphosphogluconate aldolase/(4S)-4-hydroxy-2-oxoglutarate aldolase
LESGHGAVALGRSAVQSDGVDPALLHWLRRSTSRA